MSESESPQFEPLLDSDCESRTRPHKRDSSPEPEDSDSGGAESSGETGETGDDWSRQQKRVYHRVHTLLSYWEQHGYEMLWITLTSSEESDDAERLSYNHRRLRQTVERARLAYDADGESHRLSHVNEIESLVIRTSEGPEGKGVLHLFWAWQPPEGQHSREFFVPHDWLSKQWGRIHGDYQLRELPDLRAFDEEIPELLVWVESVGDADYHSRENMAGYCVSQYLGEHGEALENVSWSWERTLGGSVTEAWEAVKSLTESLEAATEAWHEVMGGSEVSLESESEHVHYGVTVKPPPELEVVRSGIEIEPPEDYERPGPGASTQHVSLREIRELEHLPEGTPMEG